MHISHSTKEKTVNNLEGRDIDVIVQAYLLCAVWSSVDESGVPMDNYYDPDDADAETRQEAVEDCTQFLALCDGAKLDLKYWSDGQIGHDFWLTRNGHGAGFWDRGRGDVGEKASDIARTFSSVYVWAADGDTFLIE